MAANATQNKYAKRIMYSFLATFLIVAMIPVLIGSIFYTYTIRVVSENEYSKTRAMLSMNVENMDADFRRIRDIMSQLLESTYMNSLLTSKSPYDDPNTVMQSMQFRNELKQLYTGGTIIYDFLVYLKTPDTLYGAKSGYSFMRSSIYYPHFLSMEGIDEKGWNKIINDSRNCYFISARQATLEGYSGGNKQSCQLGLMVWPLYKDGLSRGSVVFIINASKFISDMEMAIETETGAVAWAQTSGGEIIMACPAIEAVPTEEGHNMVKVSMRSKYNQLEYNVLIPTAAITSKVSWLRNVIIWVVILSVIFGTIAAVYFARRLGMPLDRISYNLKQMYASEIKQVKPDNYIMALNTMQQFSNNVNELIVKHNQMKQYVSRQINVIDQLFFEKLLGGYFSDDKEATDMLEYINQPKLSGPFMLALVRFERIGTELSIAEASTMSAIRTKAFSETIGAEYDLFETSLNGCVLIFSITASEMDDIETQLRNALKRISEDSDGRDMCIKCAISVPIERFTDISYAYARCADMLYLYPERQGVSIEYQRNMPVRAYSYSLDVENQLINFTIAGNGGKVHELVLSVFGAERLSGYMSQSQSLLINGMCATIMRIGQMLGNDGNGEQKHMENAVQRIMTMDNASHALDGILECLDEFVSRVQKRQSGRTDALINSVREYVDGNYTDPELTLSSAATHFSIADAYLSRAFKDCTGVNFSAYIERLRIDHALKLIDRPLSLDEIASLTGFEHVYNLRSAFKRNLGVTPSEYRKRAKGDKDAQNPK